MINVQFAAGVYQVKASQLLPVDIATAWRFFSSAGNLQAITPPDINFKILSPAEGTLYEGQVILYEIGIFPFIKNNWVTEITTVKNEQFFVDEQRSGPYAIWHHEHHFKPVSDSSVLMTDIVTYKLPLSWLGNFIAGNWVKKKVTHIFDFRATTLSKLFAAT